VAAEGGQVGSLRVTDLSYFVMLNAESILGKTSHAEPPHLSRWRAPPSPRKRGGGRIEQDSNHLA
jgi:hypothetical protein